MVNCSFEATNTNPLTCLTYCDRKYNQIPPKVSIFEQWRYVIMRTDRVGLIYFFHFFLCYFIFLFDLFTVQLLSVDLNSFLEGWFLCDAYYFAEK